MRPLLARLTAGLMAVLPFAASAEPFGYVVGFATLYRVDLATGTASVVGQIGFNDVEGLAMSADGTLYGVADATAGIGSGVTDLLIRINTTTGAGTLVGPLPGLAGLGAGGNLDYGLAFTCDQRLWLSSDTTNQLWEVTPGNAAVRYVGNTGQPVSGLAARGNDLFGLSVGDAPALVRIDRDSAAATVVGPINAGGVVVDAGMDFDASGNLWAALDPEPAGVGASRFARLDVQTGQASVVSTSSVGLVGMEALAIAPQAACGPVGGGTNGAGRTPANVPAASGTWLSLLALLGAIGGALALRTRD